jgi:hypothetical protein
VKPKGFVGILLSKKKEILFWLCGIWAIGIGIRMIAQFLVIGGDFLVFSSSLNIFLDFVPLTIFGCLSIVIILKELLGDVGVL